MNLKSLLFLVFPLILGACGQEVEEKQWNVVFILADDLGWNQVGYHGTEFYETPHIDGIARDGVSFTNAYSANPVCSPTRASIMSGKNSARLHLTDYIPGSPYPYARLTTPVMTPYLDMEETTLAELFKSKGYATGHFGKWHLSTDKNYQPGRDFDPGSQGFDEVFTSVKPPPDADPRADAHHAIEITDRTVEFIREHSDKPFFAWVSHHTVHRPIMEKQELIDKYAAKEGADDPVNNPIMGAMMETMDNGIGRILSTLEELDLTGNTMVIFYSDNGGYEELQDQAPLRGGKAMIFEGGIKVPLAIKWPGVIDPGTVKDELVISDDFFPTLAELLEITSLPEDLDGVSLLPLLDGTGSIDRTELCFHYPHYHHQGFMPAGAIRNQQYKLIEWFEPSISGEGKALELYDLEANPGEVADVSEEHPEITRELAEKLKAWRSTLGAQEMQLNPDYDPEKADWRFEDGK